jgi:GNAT superfamily N-acetyltransferase
MRSLLASCAGARVTEIAGALCTAFDPTPVNPMLNRVLGLGLGTGVADDDLDAIEGFFADGLAYAVALAPGAGAAIAERLLARGYRRGYASTKFARDASPAPRVETELVLEAVTPDRAAVFAEVFTRAYGVPPIVRPVLERLPSRRGWQCFLAFDDGAPAAAAALHVLGTVAWLGAAGTLPEHRGRGAQTALLAKRIDAARVAGCEVLVTETGEPVDGRPGASYRNVVRAGFEPTYVRQNFLSPTYTA